MASGKFAPPPTNSAPSLTPANVPAKPMRSGNGGNSCQFNGGFAASPLKPNEIQKAQNSNLIMVGYGYNANPQRSKDATCKASVLEGPERGTSRAAAACVSSSGTMYLTRLHSSKPLRPGTCRAPTITSALGS